MIYIFYIQCLHYTQVDKNDILPKIICQNCHRFLSIFARMEKNGNESQIVLNYIAKKRVSVLYIND